jgi:hypothetical protein
MKEHVMKKNSKRLNLSRETLAHLQGEQIERVAGGNTCTASGSCPPPPTGNAQYSCLC